jgi:hypothetical protein
VRRRFALLATAVAPLALGQAARAQRVDAVLEAGVANVAYDQYSRSSAVVVAPSLLLTARRASLEARSALSLFEGGSRSGQAGGTGRVVSGERRGFSAELVADGGATLYNSVAPILYGRADLLARYRRAPAGWGLWLGPTLGFVADEPGRRAVTGASAGVWAEGVAGSYGCRVAPAAVGALAYADTELWGGWRRGRVELSASAGVRTGDLGAGSRAWLTGGGAVRVGAHYAVVAGLGAYPADLVQGVPGGRFATLAVQLRTRRASPVAEALARVVARQAPRSLASREDASAPQGFVVRSAGRGWYQLRLQAPGARHVEVTGDFTGWDAVPLDRRPDGSWEATLPISSGAHRFNVRVDGGAWTVPAGVPTVPDDYGSRVGLLTIL